ncbi:MAG: LysR family transcriptional regulator [Pseudomonadota bacterium]
MTHPAYQLDWNLIRTFTAVLDGGSMNAAASALGLTYPTVARHVQQLEEQLSLTLFDRGASGMQPTAAARALAATAETMRRQAMAFESQRNALREDSGGTVRITASEILGEALPRLLTPLKQDAAAHDAVVEVVTSDEVINLLERDADIAVRHARPTQTDLVCRQVGALPLGLWCSHDHQPQPSTFDASARYIDGLAYNNLQVGARERGIDLPQSAFSFKSDSLSSRLHAARAGWGVAVLPNYIAEQQPELRRVMLEVPMPRLPVWLVARRDMREQPLHRRAFDVLAEALAEAFPGPANDGLEAIENGTQLRLQESA